MCDITAEMVKDGTTILDYIMMYTEFYYRLKCCLIF